MVECSHFPPVKPHTLCVWALVNHFIFFIEINIINNKVNITVMEINHIVKTNKKYISKILVLKFKSRLLQLANNFWKLFFSTDMASETTSSTFNYLKKFFIYL